MSRKSPDRRLQATSAMHGSIRHGLIRISLAAWMGSLLVCASVSYYAFDDERSFFQIALGLGVCIALLYEHGVKLYLNTGRTLVCVFFYILPTTIAFICTLLNANKFLTRTQ